MAELARRYRESNNVMIWTLVAGIVFPPIWVVSYLEFDKKRKLKASVAMMNVDPDWWEAMYCT